MAPRKNCGLFALAAVLALSGCVTQTTKVGAPTAQSQTPPTQGHLSPDEAVQTDACGIRLHDIAGAILQYYALNKRLPDQLQDLAPLAGADQPLQFVCPTSGKPYGYSPAGLILDGHSKRIIVFDTTPAHEGQRWCVLMAEERRANAAQSVEVLQVPEQVFDLYRSADQ